MINLIVAPEIVDFMQQVCSAQAQECFLEKSMLDNRKPKITGNITVVFFCSGKVKSFLSFIAKIAVQVVNYYKHALHTLQAGRDDSSFSDIVGSRTYKDWIKYLSFKV